MQKLTVTPNIVPLILQGRPHQQKQVPKMTVMTTAITIAPKPRCGWLYGSPLFTLFTLIGCCVVTACVTLSQGKFKLAKNSFLFHNHVLGKVRP